MSGPGFIFANEFNTTLSQPADTTATQLTVLSMVGMPTSIPTGQMMPAVLVSAGTLASQTPTKEIVYVTAVTGTDGLIVLRAQEGTSALSWNVGDVIYCSMTAGAFASTRNIVTLTPGGDATVGGLSQRIVQVIPDLTASATITVANSWEGQIVRVFGSTHPVTVSADMDLPGNVTASSYDIPTDPAAGLTLTMGKSTWRAIPFGPVPHQTIASRKAVFASNGTFTVPGGITSIWASGCAGGGGGGSSYTDWSGGAGGGYGQWVLNNPITVTPGDVLTIALGAAGQGGQTTSADVAGVTIYTTAPGTAGGNTTITNSAGTALLTLTGGGGGGSPGNTTATTSPCPGGVGYPYGGSGNYAGGSSCGGAGASGPFGGGGCAALQNETNLVQEQLNASGYGAGGAGGVDLTPSGGLDLGGNGVPGYIVLEW